ncbi:anthrone oxygenase family protein [Spongiactinospora sp. TRM90649]|uniref:anthrone oxygenase family protein n=1 Tax=Spongiactinospora sp. TRM90649 TaxID=3031114 RepID=UPI0023F80842|nr:anthrone oxygenase family protein [Spongiactinospora sp. TRM90649]MDF5753659.1 DUF1772 domain-containing protein [Spongiactinospora sp. TRM90649]
MTELLLPLAFLTNGLAAGVMVGTLLGSVPFYRTLGVADYVRAHAFGATRYDPFQPICLLSTVVLDVVVAVTVQPLAVRVLTLAAALAAITVVGISVTRNVPMNRWIMAQDPDAMPTGWDLETFRERWARWNQTRASFAVLALVLNTSAAVALLAQAM